MYQELQQSQIQNTDYLLICDVQFDDEMSPQEVIEIQMSFYHIYREEIVFKQYSLIRPVKYEEFAFKHMNGIYKEDLENQPSLLHILMQVEHILKQQANENRTTICLIRNREKFQCLNGIMKRYNILTHLFQRISFLDDLIFHLLSVQQPASFSLQQIQKTLQPQQFTQMSKFISATDNVQSMIQIFMLCFLRPNFGFYVYDEELSPKQWKYYIHPQMINPICYDPNMQLMHYLQFQQQQIAQSKQYQALKMQQNQPPYQQENYFMHAMNHFQHLQDPTANGTTIDQKQSPPPKISLSQKITKSKQKIIETTLQERKDEDTLIKWHSDIVEVNKKYKRIEDSERQPITEFTEPTIPTQNETIPKSNDCVTDKQQVNDAASPSSSKQEVRSEKQAVTKTAFRVMNRLKKNLNSTTTTRPHSSIGVLGRYSPDKNTIFELKHDEDAEEDNRTHPIAEWNEACDTHDFDFLLVVDTCQPPGYDLIQLNLIVYDVHKECEVEPIMHYALKSNMPTHLYHRFELSHLLSEKQVPLHEAIDSILARVQKFKGDRVALLTFNAQTLKGSLLRECHHKGISLPHMFHRVMSIQSEWRFFYRQPASYQDIIRVAGCRNHVMNDSFESTWNLMDVARHMQSQGFGWRHQAVQSDAYR